ncbi:MAG: tetratricopeptide repeat protein [Tenuifilaceae bacterium]|jgi:signal transduction histidine kinase|nr:tetratricopeptide repeat protein [Tenuifilaceae bacterium]
MRQLIFILFLVITIPVSGQQSLVELERLVNEAQGEEQVKLKILLGERLAKDNPDRSLELGLEAAFLSKRFSNTLYEGKALLVMGMSSLNAKHTENALRYYNRAFAHFEKFNYPREQITALEGIAEVYSVVRNYEMATTFLNRAIRIAQRLEEKDIQLELHQRLGDIALSQNSLAKAYQEYIRVVELIGSENGLAFKYQSKKSETYGKIGFVYRNMGQFEQSLAAFRRAAELNREIDQKADEIKNLQQIALTHYLMQELDSALNYYNRVLAFYQLQKDTIPMIDVLLEIGDVFFEKEQYRQAVASYSRSLELAQSTATVQPQVRALVNISRCYNAFGDYPSSKEYLNQALAISTRENLTSSAADVYRYLSQVNEEEGRFMQALEYFKLWSELRDSIYSEESGQKLARMQILYEISQKERENEILRQNSEIQELQLTKSQYQRMVFIALALFLLALLIFFAIFYRVKQKEFIKQKDTEQRIIEINKSLERRMILEIKKQEKQQLLLAQKSKLESLGTLAAGIAHEINQPLGGLSMGLDNILIRLSEKNLSNEYLKDKVNLMFENVDRIKRIIDHTRTFSRSHKPASFERVSINEVVNNSLLMVKAQFANQGVSLRLSLTPDLEKVIADKFKLEQVVLNLLSNAKSAVDEKETQIGHPFEKTISVSTWQDLNYVCISVRDNGTGIKSKDIERIFDPFYTTKKVDKGTGLGLSIAYGFIKDILGDIAVDSKEGEFTQFDVKIPKS